MMAGFFQMNTASTSSLGHLPSNTIANPKGKLKAITTRSGLVLDEPSVPMPPPFINPKEDEHVEETLTDPKLAEDPRHLNIPYPSRMYKEKQQEKEEIQVHKFWKMFKQLQIIITLADALILILKYQKMLKALLSNKEKLLELANTQLNENCLAVILKKLPEKHGDPRNFLIQYGFSELKCKALADLGASINLMPLSFWKKLGLPELISTRMTLELANRAIYTPAKIARDVFISLKVSCLIPSPECDLILYEDFSEGAFRGVRDEEVIVGEGVVVTSSSLEMLTNSCLGGIVVSLIFLEGLEEEALVEFMVELFEEDEDGKKNEKGGLFNWKANDQSKKA
nr:hypothetical protein [Tanacetum cinerariifolium]